MSEYTFVNQLIKFFEDIKSLDLNSVNLEDIKDRLKRNDYDTVFVNENNDKPLITILGNLYDSFSRRKPQIKAITNLDVNRYMGKWYEIARYLTSFQGEDIIAATAEYYIENDSIKVINTGYREDMSPVEIIGSAKLHYPETKIGKLDVSFFPPFNGDYWIILLANDYRYSVVSNPSGEFLWILSRDKELSNEDKEYIIAFLEKLNYDISKLFYDRH